MFGNIGFIAYILIVFMKVLYQRKICLSCHDVLLCLKVEKNYHNGAAPIDSPDFPFKVGEIAEFYTDSQPKIDLSKISRVIYMNGKPANFPPTDYPQAF